MGSDLNIILMNRYYYIAAAVIALLRAAPSMGVGGGSIVPHPCVNAERMAAPLIFANKQTLIVADK